MHARRVSLDLRVASALPIPLYQYLHAGLNTHPPIIKEISQISFPQLATLEVSANQITSIEQLARIAMPRLQSLYLRTRCEM